MRTSLRIVGARFLIATVGVAVGLASTACRTAKPSAGVEGPVRPESSFQRYQLELDAYWILESPNGQQFDASGIARLADGRFLFVNDKENAIFAARVDAVSGGVVEVEEFCRVDVDGDGSVRSKRLDLEGLTVDANGNVYLCAEAGRRIFCVDGSSKEVTEVEIDWTPVKQFFGPDINASFEGIAMHGETLWIANERTQPRIFEVDLESRTVVGNFVVVAPGSVTWILHYSGLEYLEGSLFALLRFQHSILEVEPWSRRVVAEYDFGDIESSRELAFRSGSFTGLMEGVWVDESYFWLLVDNNGQPSIARSGDTRPILIRCKRPVPRVDDADSKKSFVY